MIPGTDNSEVVILEIVIKWWKVKTTGNMVLNTLSNVHRSSGPLFRPLLFLDGCDCWKSGTEKPTTTNDEDKHLKIEEYSTEICKPVQVGDIAPSEDCRERDHFQDK